MRQTTRCITLFVAGITVTGAAAAQQNTNPARQITPQSQSESHRVPNQSIPYQSTIDNSTCEGATLCQVTFKPVPAHMRLVVTHYNANASFTTSATDNFVYSTLTGASDGVISTFLHTTATAGFSFVNDATLMYFEAGQTPTAQATNATGLINLRVTLSGYFTRAP